MKRFNFVAALAAATLAASTAIAQPVRDIPRVALLDRGEVIANMTESGHPYWGALLSALRELGYVEGETVAIDRWSNRGQTNETYADWHAVSLNPSQTSLSPEEDQPWR